MNPNTLKKKFIIIFLIIAMLVPYVPVFTPVTEAATTSQTFNYTGGIQEYIVPEDGIYKLEVWGAAGGFLSWYNLSKKEGIPGAGGYSVGYVKLTKGTKLYIGVGGRGEDTRRISFDEETNNYEEAYTAGGYNGGGNAGEFGSPGSGGAGGGATHIAINHNLGELYHYENNKEDVLIVAGGGAGAAIVDCRLDDEDGPEPDHGYCGNHYLKGGDGGGLTGGDGEKVSCSIETGTGGTQTSGGSTQSHSGASYVSGYFGRAQHINRNKFNGMEFFDGTPLTYASGAGGGWYGGGQARHAGASGGGSSYIGGVPTFTYSGVTYSPNTIAGQRVDDDGKAVITYVKALSHTLTINPSGGSYSGSTSIEVAPGETASVPNPTLTGHTFTGWTVAGSGSSINGTTFTMGNEDTTLTATWARNNYNLNVNPNGRNMEW